MRYVWVYFVILFMQFLMLEIFGLVAFALHWNLLLAIAAEAVVAWIAGEVIVVLYEKLPFIRTKIFYLGYFLPISVCCLVGGVVCVILHCFGLLNPEYLFPVFNFESVDLSFGRVLQSLIVAFAFDLGLFLVTGFLSVRHCSHCHEEGLGLFNVKVTTTKEWSEYQDAGPASSSVTLTDSSGNTYSGSVENGRVYKEIKHELRKRTATCKKCGYQYSTENEYTIGLLRKIIDALTGRGKKE